MKTFAKALFAICILGCFAFAKTSITSTKETVKIVIDAGHGGKDSGQNIKGIKEKEVVYQITQKIKELHQNKNVELYFSRPNNEFVSLEKRVEFINTIQPDLVISLHANGHPQFEDKNGTEIFISKNNSFKDKNYEFASKLAGHLAIQPNSLGKVSIKNANFKIIRESKAPAMLIEVGFLTNEKERKFLNSSEGQTEVANNILKFINEI